MVMQQGLRGLMQQTPRATQPPVDKNRLAMATDVMSSDAEKAILEPPTLALIKYKDAVDAIQAADGIMAGMNAPQQNLNVAERTKMQAEEGLRGLAERLSPGLQTRGKQIQTAQARKMMGGLPMARAQGGIVEYAPGGDVEGNNFSRHEFMYGPILKKLGVGPKYDFGGGLNEDFMNRAKRRAAEEKYGPDAAMPVGSGQPIPMLMQKYGSEQVMKYLNEQKRLRDIEGNVAPERREDFEMMKANIESLFDPQMIRDIRRAQTGPDEVEMASGGEIQKFNEGTEVRGVGSFYRNPETGEPIPFSDRLKKLLMMAAGPRFKEEAEAPAQPPAPREVTDAVVEPREGGAGDPDVEEVSRTGIIDMLRRPQPDPGFVMPGVNPTGGRDIVPRQTTGREDLTTELLEVLGQPLDTPSISPELEAMRPDLLAAEQTMLDPDRPARERERISEEAREAYAIPEELRALVEGQQAELAKPLYSEEEESSRRIDAALSALASSNRAFQSGPRALAALNKVTDDIEKFRRENTEKSFQLGVGLIEKDMAGAQKAFDAGLEAQKTANGQLTAAMQTLSSRLTGADNIAFNRALLQRQEKIRGITEQLNQLNKAEQLDVQERQLLVNIGRNITTNLATLGRARDSFSDQLRIVADREDQTQANEIRAIMRNINAQIDAEQSNLDFINSRFGLEVAPSPPASGITGGSPDLPAGFVED